MDDNFLIPTEELTIGDKFFFVHSGKRSILNSSNFQITNDEMYSSWNSNHWIQEPGARVI